MSDDRLLRALGRTLAEQSAERERWEAAAASPEGTPAADEKDELARRLFAPASDAFVERMSARVVASLGVAADPAAKVVPTRGRAARWAGVVAVPLAAAAAIAFFVTRPAADLPAYTLSVSGGVRQERGAETRAPSEPVGVAPGAELVLVARPDARARDGVHTSTFVVRSGAPTPVRSMSEVSDKGAVRVTVLGDDLAEAVGGGGLVSLVLVVDRSAADDSRALAAADGATREWSRFTVPVRVAPPGH
jgi:hypothetical protein